MFFSRRSIAQHAVRRLLRHRLAVVWVAVVALFFCQFTVAGGLCVAMSSGDPAMAMTDHAGSMKHAGADCHDGHCAATLQAKHMDDASAKLLPLEAESFVVVRTLGAASLDLPLVDGDAPLRPPHFLGRLLI